MRYENLGDNVPEFASKIAIAEREAKKNGGSHHAHVVEKKARVDRESGVAK